MELQQKRVKEFMQLFGQECPDKPIQLDEATAKLRAALILEECLETICKGLGLRVILTKNARSQYFDFDEQEFPQIEFEKIKDVDIIETIDGVSDISVVSYGLANAMGVDMELVDIEVSRSNNSKAWKPEELEEAKNKYPMVKVEKYGESLYRLIREDGKVIKSPNYSKADIKSIIEKQKS